MTSDDEEDPVLESRVILRGRSIPKILSILHREGYCFGYIPFIGVQKSGYSLLQGDFNNRLFSERDGFRLVNDDSLLLSGEGNSMRRIREIYDPQTKCVYDPENHIDGSGI